MVTEMRRTGQCGGGDLAGLRECNCINITNPVSYHTLVYDLFSYYDSHAPTPSQNTTKHTHIDNYPDDKEPKKKKELHIRVWKDFP